MQGVTGLDLIIPQFIAMLLKQSGLDKRANTIIVFLVYVGWVLASLGLGLRGLPHGSVGELASSFFIAFPIALAAGYAAYTTLWKNLLGEETLTHTTSVVKAPVEEVVEHDGTLSVDHLDPPVTPTPTDPNAEPSTDAVDDGTG